MDEQIKCVSALFFVFLFSKSIFESKETQLQEKPVSFGIIEELVSIID